MKAAGYAALIVRLQPLRNELALATAASARPGSPPSWGMRRKRSDPLIFGGDVLVGVVRQQRGRDDAYDGAAEDIKGDRKARLKGGKQRRSNKRRGAASDDRGKLIA